MNKQNLGAIMILVMVAGAVLAGLYVALQESVVLFLFMAGMICYIITAVHLAHSK